MILKILLSDVIATLAVALGGALLAAGTVAVAAWAGSAKARKVRP